MRAAPPKLGGRSFVECGELRAVVGDEDREKARRLGGARVLADEMRAAGRLEEALARLVDARRTTGRAVLRADRAREHVGEDAAGMPVAARLAARRVADDDRGHALARDVGQLLSGDPLHRPARIL